jgi:hypothetical protein
MLRGREPNPNYRRIDVFLDGSLFSTTVERRASTLTAGSYAVRATGDDTEDACKEIGCICKQNVQVYVFPSGQLEGILRSCW